MLYPPALLAIHPGECYTTTNFLEGDFAGPSQDSERADQLVELLPSGASHDRNG